MTPYTCTLVRGKWRGPKPRWLPVRLPMHTDAGELEFPWKHWHVDYRFLRGESDAADLDSVIAQPLMLMNVVPEGGIPDTVRTRDYLLPETRADVEKRVEEFLRTVPKHTWQKQARWKQRRSYVDYHIHNPPRREYLGTASQVLSSQIAARLKGKYKLNLETRICPHRGADLSDVTPIAGIIQCPLHGLRFCARTGVRVHETRKKNS